MSREERDALRTLVDRRKIDRDVPPDVENMLDDLLDALDATEAEVAAFQSWKDESVWVAEVHRVRAERDEARAEVERLWIEVRNASDTLIRQGQIMHGLAKQVARVRALHFPGYTAHGSPPRCEECGSAHPCATLRALRMLENT